MEQLLKLREVLDRTGLGKTSIYRLMKEDRFPKAIKVGSAARWAETAVQAWIAEQIDRGA